MPILLAKHLLINLVLLVMMTEVIRMEETVRFPTLVNCSAPGVPVVSLFVSTFLYTSAYGIVSVLVFLVVNAWCICIVFLLVNT